MIDTKPLIQLPHEKPFAAVVSFKGRWREIANRVGACRSTVRNGPRFPNVIVIIKLSDDPLSPLNAVDRHLVSSSLFAVEPVIGVSSMKGQIGLNFVSSVCVKGKDQSYCPQSERILRPVAGFKACSIYTRCYRLLIGFGRCGAGRRTG